MKKLILLILVFLFTSCGAIQWNLSSGYEGYDSYYYDYNRINSLYLQNPRWVYDNYYLGAYGNRIYYYQHPYFIRYQKDRIKKQKRRSYNVNTRNISPNIKTRVRNTTTTPIRNNSTRKYQPNTRQNTQVKRTSTRTRGNTQKRTPIKRN